MRGDAIDLKFIRTFLAVIAGGSYTSAAASLGLTQQAVSAQMARLETIVGHGLFARSNGRITPSPEGLVFQLYAERALAVERELRAHFARTTIAQPVRFGMLEAFIASGLPAVMAAVVAQEPPIAIEVAIGTGTSMVPLLEEGLLDVIIGAERMTESNGIPLWAEKQLWVGDERLVPTDGSAIPLVLRAAPSLGRALGIEALVAKGMPFHVRAESDRMDVLRIAIAAGAGIGVMSASEVRDEPIIRDVLPELGSLRAFLKMRPSSNEASDRLGELVTQASKSSPSLQPFSLG